MDASMAPKLSDSQRVAVNALADQLKHTLGHRLHALVAYGRTAPDEFLHTLALADRVTFEDLTAIAPSIDRWRRAGLAVPLLLSREEFARSLDVFPAEYGEIVARHIVILGDAPFGDAKIAETDLRRSCELQAKSHLIHLREGFLEAGGDLNEVVYLIASSSHAFRSLLSNIARLDGELTTPPYHSGNDDALAKFAERVIDVPASLVHDVFGFRPNSGSIAEPTALLGRYIGATERIWAYVDGWKRR
jgi:hypothetical protein